MNEVPTASMAEPPWCFVLPPDALWPGKQYVIGAICLSCDRIGREFPFTIWQCVSRKGLRLSLLFGKNSIPRNWLFWLSRLFAAYPGKGKGASQATLPHFELALRRLWEAHKPSFTAWLGFRGRPSAPEAYGDILDLLPESDLRGVTLMPWRDWPDRLLAPEALCYFWQQDNDGRYLRVFQDRTLGQDTIPWLFSARFA
jgi:hypothetical protein